MGLLYGRAGRLTAQNGNFRRGQVLNEKMYDGLTEEEYNQMHIKSRIENSIKDRMKARDFLCLITPLCSYLHGGLYGGLYGEHM
jgi:hypothetical protein